MGQEGRAPGRRLRAAALAALLTALALLVGAAPASAHDYLVSSDPAAGSTVTKPLTTVTLTFDAAVLSTGNGSTVLAVTGPGGRHFETACPVVKNDDVSTAVQLGTAGTYTATWRIVSADGHPVSDSIHFRYAPTTVPASVAPGSANGPACGNAAASSGSDAAPASSTGGTGTLVLLGVVGGVLLLLVVAVGVVAVVLTRRRTP